MSNNNSSNAGVWVKASTNPTKTDNYHVKITPNFITKEAPFNAACIFNSHGWQTPPGYKVLEWLDEQPIPQSDYWKDIEELGMGIDNAMAIINECELKVVKGHPDPGALNDCINNVKDAHRHWQQLKSSPSPTPQKLNDEELDNEFRMIISHALLGEDEQISRDGFNLVIKGCVEFAKKLLSNPSPTPVNEKEVQAEWEFLIIMRENYEAAKRGSEEDFAGTTKKEAVIEIYEDLIDIIKNLPLKRSGKEQQVIDYVNNLPQPSTPVQEGLREDEKENQGN